MARTIEKVTRQVNVFGSYFPELNSFNVRSSLAIMDLPKNAEDWYAIPKWQRLGNTYCRALKRMLDSINNLRKGSFCPFYDGRWMNLDDIELKKETKEAINILNLQQGGYDFLVFPCQLGSNRPEESVEDALDSLSPHEFPLGPFEVASIILTHQDIIKKSDEFSSIVCPGAEYIRFQNKEFKTAPSFIFYKDLDIVEFIDIYTDIFIENSGNATGFFR